MLLKFVLRIARIVPQYVWERLHRLALIGMNIGLNTQVASSGEAHFVKSLLGGRTEAVVIDVGANRGDYTASVRVASPDAIVHAFEPAAEVYVGLAQRFDGDRRVRTWQLALSDQSGEQLLRSPAGHDTLASLVHRDLGHVGLHVDQAEAVISQTLDEWAESNHIHQIALLKLDVEGHELAVLDGASGLMVARAIEAIQFEFGGCNLDSRTYVRDFFYRLHDRYRIYRILQRGLRELHRYDELLEVFTTTNFVALAR